MEWVEVRCDGADTGIVHLGGFRGLCVGGEGDRHLPRVAEGENETAERGGSPG